ncbi:hypothetical protein FB45DRAFT_1063000 [Roridomyces roridus]|nr:hypothetical protein FB45DRAFT_1063000 [Roridomyces roridus]
MRTRSAKRALMCITRWLPNEILNEIIQNAPKSDQATLCRVSELFHALVLPIVNQTVVLRTDNCSLQVLEAFCCAMIRNPARADSVRSLTFMNGSPNDVPAEDVLIKSLELMRRLEHFSITDLRPVGVISRLATLTFPNLLSCTLPGVTTTTWNLHFAHFLSRHLTITHLCLGCIDQQNLDPAPQGILLPRLQYYSGALQLLFAFPMHSLVAVRALWSVRSPSLVKRFSTLSCPNLTSFHIDNFFGGQAPAILTHLSTHMPHCENLKLHTYGSGLSIEFVNDISVQLPRFERLAYLLFTAHESDPAGVDSDIQRSAFRAWANICPTLRGCCLDDRGWRKVGGTWEECSGEVIHLEAGFAAFDEVFSQDQ